MRYKEKVDENIDPTYYSKLAMIESSNNPKARAKTSSAAGLYQFTKGTWKNMVSQMGLDYSLEDRFDPNKSKRVVEEFTKQNYKYLKGKLRRDVTSAELYLAHFLGMGGSNNLLSAYDQDPNMRVDKVLQNNQLVANKSIFYNKDGTLKKVKDIYNWANKKLGMKVPERDYDVPTQKEVTSQDKQQLATTIENYNKERAQKENPVGTIPLGAIYDGNTTPYVYIPEAREEIVAESTKVADAKSQIDNRQQILQQLMTANAVQYIDPNESADPEPNSYGYPNQ